MPKIWGYRQNTRSQSLQKGCRYRSRTHCFQRVPSSTIVDSPIPISITKNIRISKKSIYIVSLYSKYVLKSILMSMTSLNKHRTKLIILGSKSKKPIREGSRLKSKILIRPLKGEPDQRSDTELKLSLNMLNPNHICEQC